MYFQSFEFKRHCGTVAHAWGELFPKEDFLILRTFSVKRLLDCE